MRKLNKNKETKTTKNVSKIGKIRKSFAVLVAGVMIGTTASSLAVPMMASATTASTVSTMNISKAETNIKADQYNGHDITDGSYKFDGYTIDFKYSDGFFETDAKQYDPHMATMSCTMAYASTTVIKKDYDFSEGPKNIKDVLSQMGFEDLYASEAYTQVPTPDTVACAIGSKNVETKNGTKKIVAITVRSANYEKEWASNVTLGKDGEAEGFAKAADQVTKEVNQYLEDHDMTKGAEDGDVVFWLSGFSRGGATANLTAKRLIDQYGDGKVYAYTIEAPQGGVASAERSDRDYTVIHNITCKDDPVPYVAPTEWGFKRYGVDHSIYDENWDSENLQKSFFGNNLADNDCFKDVSYERLGMVKDEIDKVTGSKASDYYPVASFDSKTIGFHYEFDLTPPFIHFWFSIDNNGKIAPSDVINSFVHNLSTNVSRSQYVDTGIQDAAKHVMSFLNSNGVHLKDITDAIGIGDTIWNTIKDSIWDYALDYAQQIVLHPLDIPSWLPPIPSADYLIAGLKDALNSNQKIHDIF
ncbi:MAG: hypothetical protein II574_03325, partial [Ruminococcus sp.]|nr:hypothetical protein [Ruminococcus sp.]